MRAVIQRATSGEVRVDGKVVGRLAFVSPAEAGSGAGRRSGFLAWRGGARRRHLQDSFVL